MSVSNTASPVDCDMDFDTSNLQGKTAVVTVDTNSISKAYVRALIAARALVCIGDLDIENSQKLVAESSRQATLTKCDTTDWDQQIHLVQTAASFPPTGKIHYVVANAGIIKQTKSSKTEVH